MEWPRHISLTLNTQLALWSIFNSLLTKHILCSENLIPACTGPCLGSEESSKQAGHMHPHSTHSLIFLRCHSHPAVSEFLMCDWLRLLQNVCCSTVALFLPWPVVCPPNLLCPPWASSADETHWQPTAVIQQWLTGYPESRDLSMLHTVLLPGRSLSPQLGNDVFTHLKKVQSLCTLSIHLRLGPSFISMVQKELTLKVSQLVYQYYMHTANSW